MHVSNAMQSYSYFIANVLYCSSNSALLVLIISLIIYIATSCLLQKYIHMKSSPCKIHPIKYNSLLDTYVAIASAIVADWS